MASATKNAHQPEPMRPLPPITTIFMSCSYVAVQRNRTMRSLLKLRPAMPADRVVV